MYQSKEEGAFVCLKGGLRIRLSAIVTRAMLSWNGGRKREFLDELRQYIMSNCLIIVTLFIESMTDGPF